MEIATARLCSKKGYIRLIGPYVDSIVAGLSDEVAAFVPLTHRTCRKDRDESSTHHITVLNRSETDKLAGGAWKATGGLKSLVETLQRALRGTTTAASGLEVSEEMHLPVPIGLGHASSNECDSSNSGSSKHSGGSSAMGNTSGAAVAGAAEAFFVSLCWPSGQLARVSVGLPPKDYHVTVGFLPKDVHTSSKGVSSLVRPHPVPHLLRAACHYLDELGHLPTANNKPASIARNHPPHAAGSRPMVTPGDSRAQLHRHTGTAARPPFRLFSSQSLVAPARSSGSSLGNVGPGRSGGGNGAAVEVELTLAAKFRAQAAVIAATAVVANQSSSSSSSSSGGGSSDGLCGELLEALSVRSHALLVLGDSKRALADAEAATALASKLASKVNAEQRGLLLGAPREGNDQRNGEGNGECGSDGSGGGDPEESRRLLAWLPLLQARALRDHATALLCRRAGTRKYRQQKQQQEKAQKGNEEEGEESALLLEMKACADALALCNTAFIRSSLSPPPPSSSLSSSSDAVEDGGTASTAHSRNGAPSSGHGSPVLSAFSSSFAFSSQDTCTPAAATLSLLSSSASLGSAGEEGMEWERFRSALVGDLHALKRQTATAGHGGEGSKKKKEKSARVEDEEADGGEDGGDDDADDGDDEGVPPPPPIAHVYCDLDGVLADFDQGVRSLTLDGRGPDELNVRDMWSMVRQCRRPGGFFGSLEWQPGGRELWESIRHWGEEGGQGGGTGNRLTILTGLPHGGHTWAAGQKRAWCNRVLRPVAVAAPPHPHAAAPPPPTTTTTTTTAAAAAAEEATDEAQAGVVAGSCGVFKEVICCMSKEKPQWARSDRVLIDDRAANGRAWTAAGGLFVHHVTIEQTLVELGALGLLKKQSLVPGQERPRLLPIPPLLSSSASSWSPSPSHQMGKGKGKRGGGRDGGGKGGEGKGKGQNKGSWKANKNKGGAEPKRARYFDAGGGDREGAGGGDGGGGGGKPPCSFFSSAAGCRHGSACRFVHK